MKTLFDTSVVVAALIKNHPRHPQAHPVLAEALQGRIEGALGCHSLAELFSVLTGAYRNVLPAEEVNAIFREYLLPKLELVALGSSDYRRVLGRMAAAGYRGAHVYDALIAEAAIKAKAKRLVTLNLRDFSRFPWLGEAGVEVQTPA